MHSPESHAALVGSTSARRASLFWEAHASFAGIEEMIYERPNRTEVGRRLQEWVDGLGMRHRKARAYLREITQYLAYSGIVDGGYNPYIRLSGPESSDYIPDASELRELLAECDARRRLMYAAMLSGGISLREAMELRKKEVITDLERLVVRIRGRDGKERHVVFSIEVTKSITRLLERIGDDDAVFAPPGSRRSTLSAETRYLRSRVRLADLRDGRRLTPGSFRKFFLKNAGKYNHIIASYLAGSKTTVNGEKMTPKMTIYFYMKFEEDLLIYDQIRDLGAPNRTNMKQNRAETLLAETSELERRLKRLEDAIS